MLIILSLIAGIMSTVMETVDSQDFKYSKIKKLYNEATSNLDFLTKPSSDDSDSLNKQELLNNHLPQIRTNIVKLENSSNFDIQIFVQYIFDSISGIGRGERVETVDDILTSAVLLEMLKDEELFRDKLINLLLKVAGNHEQKNNEKYESEEDEANKIRDDITDKSVEGREAPLDEDSKSKEQSTKKTTKSNQGSTGEDSNLNTKSSSQASGQENYRSETTLLFNNEKLEGNKKISDTFKKQNPVKDKSEELKPVEDPPAESPEPSEEGENVREKDKSGKKPPAEAPESVEIISTEKDKPEEQKPAEDPPTESPEPSEVASTEELKPAEEAPAESPEPSEEEEDVRETDEQEE